MNDSKDKPKPKAKCVLCGEDLGTGDARITRVDNKARVVHRICPTNNPQKETGNMAKKSNKKEKKVAKKSIKKEDVKKPVKKEKKETITALMRQLLKEKKGYEACEKEVKKKFPKSKFNKNHYNWYVHNV